MRCLFLWICCTFIKLFIENIFHTICFVHVSPPPYSSQVPPHLPTNSRLCLFLSLSKTTTKMSKTERRNTPTHKSHKKMKTKINKQKEKKKTYKTKQQNAQTEKKNQPKVYQNIKFILCWATSGHGAYPEVWLINHCGFHCRNLTFLLPVVMDCR